MRSDKQKIMAVDYNDNVIVFWEKLNGRLYGTDDVRRLMGKIAEMGATGVFWRTACTGAVTYRSKVRTRVDECRPCEAVPISLLPDENTFRQSPPGTSGSTAPFWKDILAAYDPAEVAVSAAREAGLEIYLYTTLFDEGYPGYESEFALAHPEYCWRHRNFGHYNRGLLAYGYDKVRAYKLAEVKELLSYEPDGVYLDCARSHSGIWPLICLPYGYDVYANYGFNDPECREYERRTGVDPRLSNLGKVELEKLDWRLWQQVRGSFLTQFMREASEAARRAKRKLGVGFYTDAACYLSPAGERGRQILGGIDIDWETWVREALVDRILLIAEHRRFGWPDWENHSAAQFAEAQARGVEVLLWAATEQGIDELPDPPTKLPMRLTREPELFMTTVAANVAKCLATSADGVVMYEAAWQEEAELVNGWDYWGHLRRALKP